MNTEELKGALDKLSNAVRRLKEALEVKDETLTVDGTIKRFEFTFEICWKVLKLFLEAEGVICKSPRACLREAFRLDYFVRENIWLDMLDDRNAVAHIYDEEEALSIYKRIPLYYKEFCELLKNLKNKINELK